jgi:hypothetical protein
MSTQFKMMFGNHREDGTFETVEDKATHKICQEINRAFAEHGHEVSFKPNGVLDSFLPNISFWDC